MHAQIELQDALQKFNSYLTRIVQQQQQHSLSINISSISHGNPIKNTKPLSLYDDRKMEKLCHLALETFIKFCESQELCRDIYNSLKKQTILHKSYYLLYTMDLVLKNSKYIIKYAKKELESLFKPVWEKTFHNEKALKAAKNDTVHGVNVANFETNNEVAKSSSKLENLKLMAKTWSYIYGEKYEAPIKKYLEDKYSVELNALDPKHRQRLTEIYGEEILIEKPKTQTTSNIDANLLDKLRDDEEEDQNQKPRKLGMTSSQEKKSLDAHLDLSGRIDQKDSKASVTKDKLSEILGFGDD